VECLLEAGVETVLLTALPAGKNADGVQPGAIEDAAAYDAKATGEDRREFLELFANRVRVPRGPEQSGYRIALPWGAGP
jgi:hypothetical protein